MRFGGANQSELWLAFARRGLGRFASSTTGTGRVRGVESDTDPLPDFEAPDQGNATITFDAVSRQTPEPAVPARIYVGHYEARISPVADTDPATNAPATASTNNLDATATFAPGTYEFVATSPGYGAVRFRRTFRAGVNQAITLHMAPNWASKGQGASASGDAAPVMNGTRVVQPAAQVNSNLIDDTENTNWQAAATQQGAEWSVNGKQATIDLAGSSPVRISRVQVSAFLGPVFDAGPPATDLSQNRFTALRSFEIWTCNSRFGDCANDSGYQVAYRSADDAFPADVPRPVAPMLLMREFAFSPVQATHLRLVVRSSQCTGGPAYQGEQDADPLNATDCNAVVEPSDPPIASSSPATRFVRVAEVQAFSQPSTVTVG
jgi:extracellular elastinolytic metalloproteinase